MRFSHKEFDLEEQADPYLGEYRNALALVKFDPNAAISKLEDMAYNGSILSVLYIADSLRRGWIYEKNLSEAEKWYRIAACIGSQRGQYGLGLVYHERECYDDALREFQVSTSNSYPPAMFMLGWMYYFGQSVEICLQRAKCLWMAGSEYGHFNCMKLLSELLASGKLGLWRIPIGYLWKFRAMVIFLLSYSRNKYSYRFR